MRAIAYTQNLPADDPQALLELDLAEPVATGYDLLVEVKAVSVNPTDCKRRASAPLPKGAGPQGEDPQVGEYCVLGFDAAGVVVAVGEQCTLFKPGDEVFYAGDASRSGSYAQRQLVDERIVGPKPKSLDFARAAALPLTAITAWEGLFHRIDINRPVPGAAAAVLIIGGAGGVGSIAVQLARQLTDLSVLATASRPQTREWLSQLGAHHVIDHSAPMAPQIKALDMGQPGLVFSTNQSTHHLPDIARLIAPQGRFGLIDDLKTDIMSLKRKSVSVHWEAMFARSLFGTADMIEQHKLLKELSALVDAGTIKTTLSDDYGPITAANVLRAHAQIEGGHTKGKIVLSGW